MKTILLQLDTDPRPSSFDRVVAVDAGVDEVFAYGGVTPENVVPLVHGAIFTRGPKDLQNTAIFVGGSRVADGEALARAATEAFFGPMRVSVLMDSNGSNTTAAAAVLAARRHVNLAETEAVVLGATGPVGQRAAQLLAAEGASVRVASRSVERAEQVCQAIAAKVEGAKLAPCESETVRTLEGTNLVVAAGAAGVQFFDVGTWQWVEGLEVAIDLNAVPPVGLQGIEVTDKAADRNGITCYGAIGVGGTKMAIHRAAVQKLFTANDLVLDTEAVYALGGELE